MFRILYFFNYLFSFTIPVILFSVGLYLCFKLRFFHFRHPVKTMRMSFSKGGKGQIKAMLMALGGTLGVGNIAGVALAIIYGGAGSVFWMWISALIVMLIKYSEILLAQKYRQRRIDTYEGGAMYYIRDGVGRKKLASVFGILCLLSSLAIGALIQSNAIAESMKITFNFNTVAVGGVLAFFTFFLSVSGEKAVSSVLSVIVPFMSVMYILMSFAVIGAHIGNMPDVLFRIIREAFSFRAAATGGACGAVTAIKYGVARGLFSNEAGVGTAPMAHATAKSDFPARQGVMGIVEVFCDTILICTLTALSVLVVFDEIPIGILGMELVINAFASVFGNAAGVLISISVFFFAFATIILWSYYVQVCVHYFVTNRYADVLFLCIYAVAVSVGTSLTEEKAWLFCDIITSSMTIINLYAVMKLSGEVKTESLRFGLPINKK